MPKTSVHLLSRKESERRRAGRNPGERESVTTDGQRGSTLRVRATIRGRDEIESIPYIETKILFHHTKKTPFLLSSHPADSPTAGNRYPTERHYSTKFAGQRYREIHIRKRTRITGVYVLHCRECSLAWTIGRVSSDGTRSPEITMNPNSFGLLVTCLPKRAAPTPQYHASKDKLNHGPSCHPQSRAQARSTVMT
ncbi:hypothetical protein ALC56_12241 [Trachymyrmex septentrionalis]|uniref:Uncharacterized protein n=1 Tax=Trachymyrmex septentrionalis TaxID=34720 RepID=A0A195F082_9HYME|nr:hypothetical protein ALC56_12241 [Trachymyrmex septentrionalis]